jgi:RNA polymerase sigma-70 factor (ECF subfamily)
MRPLPTGLGGPSRDPSGKLAERPEVLWLEPVPDALVGGHRDTIGLELVAALQYLPPHQRVALILRDVEGWPTHEVAEVLDTTTATVDGLLIEARGQFDPGPSGVVDHTLPDQCELLERYARAFELYDVPAIVGLFADDAVWEMPPFTSWFRGAKNIGRLISTHCPAEGPGDQLLVPIKANGQPGFAVYLRDPVENVHRAFQLQVLTLTLTGIIHAVAFFDVSLFDAFSLPDLFTGLPESFADNRPRIHLERIRHNHDQGEG